MYRVFTFFTLFFLAHFPGRTQQLNYVHYDTKDGLAGSTVYGVSQDPDGFIWFATDFGVSRFDGKRFRNFTTDFGLPDNEVLDVSADSSSRVWIIPFNGHACYYYKGKIYTEQTDTLIKKINSLGAVGTVRQYPNGRIYFSLINRTKSYVLENDNSLTVLVNMGEFFKNIQPGNVQLPMGQLRWSSDYNQYDIVNNKLYHFNQFKKYGLFVKDLPEYLKNKELYLLRALHPDSLVGVQYKGAYNFISDYPFIPDSLAGIINTKAGSYPIHWDGGLGAPFLPGKNISKTFCDREGNFWFTTLGEGVYKLQSRSMKTIAAGREIFSLVTDGDAMLAGDNLGVLHRADAAGGGRNFDFRQYNDNGNQRRLYCMKAMPDRNVFLGFDCFLLKKTVSGNTIFSAIRPIKSIDYVDERHIVVSTNYFTMKLQADNMSIVDTIFRDRATKVLYRNGQYFIGTLNGVVIVDAQKRQTALGKQFSLLSSRVADMCWAPDGGVFVATNDKGVVKYDKESISAHYNLANGLSSNICRSLYCDGQNLWVGTNKGINKINLSNNRVEVQYTISNGLPSDIINALYAKNGVVWAGTPAGLTYFNEQDISNNSICNLVMERIVVDGRAVDTMNNLALNWRQNNISFEFSGISMKAAGDITYHYRLNGLDENWKEIKQNSLSYPSLPSGKYKLEIYAVNKFGRQSGMITVNFSIATPFWKTTWFWVFTALAIASIIILLLNRRYRQNLRRRDEKNRVSREISEARQQALQAQMNPHFVFNCLNSIQQFIMLNEKEKANKYLTEFAHLIRKTLENSEKKNVTVAAEIAYLRQYLEMEQLRYGDAFDFTIRKNEALQADFIEMPAMLLQPYIENSLRHGIRHKTNGKGLIELLFLQENDLLTCVVKDNGIGRTAAQQLKSIQHIEYQSKGMALTARRIELLNTQGNAGIKVLVADVPDENGTISGTQVTIQIPLK